MKITVKRIISSKIDHCYHQCPYFSVSTNMMECGHPYWDEAAKKDPWVRMIISHPECDTGFPKECPLIKDLTNEKNNDII